MSETSRRSGGAGDRRERKERTPREEKSAYVERVVAINRVSKVVVLSTDDNGELHVDKDWANAVGAPY